METTPKFQNPSLSEYLPSHWLELPKDDEIHLLPTIDDIKESLAKYEQTYEVNRENRLPLFLKKAQNADFRHDDPNIFIVIKTTNAYTLKPNITQKHFLYRGQIKFHDICKPNVRRDKNISHLAENIRREEFNILLDSHPLFKLLKEGVKLENDFTFRLDNPYGLAQHYEFKTTLLDLTSDFDIASFFATTEYDSPTSTYFVPPNKQGCGVIYVYHMIEPYSMLTRIDKLSTIGLQVFPRSGNQKGFLWMPSRSNVNCDFHESPYVTSVFFRHDHDIAENIFKNMNRGKHLFENDILAAKAKMILSSNTFSMAAFERNLEENKKDDPCRNMSLLQQEGITINPKQKPITFTEQELDEYYKWVIAGGWEDFCEQIVFPNDTDGKLKKELLSIKDREEYHEYFHKTKSSSLSQ